MKFEFPVRVYDRVPCVVSPGETYHIVSLLGQKVYYFALTFVSPLGSYHHYRGH